MSKKGITKRSENYSQWYLDVIAAANLADNSPVRGCMVIKPDGFAIWENIQKVLDQKLKATGARNAYFPLLIPLSFLTREAEHVEGFAKESAIVTHHRLKKDKTGKLIPDGPLEEPLIVRPTSETIIYEMFSKWIQSYRDLPLLINQWANVVRWELRTRPFLRTTEFLWQEGHTAHANKKEAEEKASEMLGVYREFVEEYLALPVIAGRKTETEKFAGAQYTLSIEALMQDGKALQAGTSHMLGQNFAKVFGVKFLSEEGQEQYVWQTSWGLSTRIMGALIMTHSDDLGLVLPPRIAPLQAVVIPIWSSAEEEKTVLPKAEEIALRLQKELGTFVKIDKREGRPGYKFFEWERKGVPIRIEIGPREVSQKSIILARRDTGEKKTVKEENFVLSVKKLLQEIQDNLWQRALDFQKKNTHFVDSWTDFENALKNQGGFLLAHWCGRRECEEKIAEETKATIRCIPENQKRETGKCVLCGKKSERRVLFAKAY